MPATPHTDSAPPRPPRVLYVDSEAENLALLAPHLRRHFELFTAQNSPQAQHLLESDGPFAVIVCDQNLPGIAGTRFLATVRERHPDTVRILLAGHPDMDAAIEAINLGQIFRFLRTPCLPGALVQAVSDAVELHQLVTSERILLQETLRGSILALIDVMSLTNPHVFGKAHRIRNGTLELMDGEVAAEQGWSIEMAAMLSQLACATLPPELAEKLYYGHTMSAAEQVLVNRLPEVTEQLLGHIPRIEGVRAILRYQHRPEPAVLAGVPELLRAGARALRIVLAFDELRGQGLSPAAAVDLLAGRGAYDPILLNRLRKVQNMDGGGDAVVELPLRQIRPGMVLAEDVRSDAGTLLIPRGFRATRALCDRIELYPEAVQRLVVRVEAAG